jgi:hypothetical protein
MCIRIAQRGFFQNLVLTLYNSFIGTGKNQMIHPTSKKFEYLYASLSMILGLFVGASFLSFSPADPSFYSVSYPLPDHIRNWGGAVGAEMASHGLFQLGLACFFVPLFFVILRASVQD